MEKNSTLETKLKKYTALAGGLTAAVAGTGQIYTDINPDVVLNTNGDSLAIDFNGDAIVDVTLAMFEGTFSGSFAYGTGSVSYTGTYVGAGAEVGSGANAGWMSTTSGALANVAAGAAIGAAGSFSSSGAALGVVQGTYLGPPFATSYGPYSNGNFLGATDAYIGIQFDASGAAHYGWVRVDMSAEGDILTIKDYAFQPIPGADIIAGDMGTVGISELNNFASIVSTNNNVVISLLNGTNSADATITSVSGQQVFSQSINSDREEIELKDFASGIYMVNVRSEKGIVSKKVYVK